MVGKGFHSHIPTFLSECVIGKASFVPVSVIIFIYMYVPTYVFIFVYLTSMSHTKIDDGQGSTQDSNYDKTDQWED